MGRFIMMFLLVYGGMHAYLVWRIQRAFPASRGVLIGAIVFALVMVLMPILARRFEVLLGERVGSIVLLFAFTWAFWIFWFLMMGLAVDAWNLAFRLVALRHAGAGSLMLPPGKALLAFSVIIILATLWGLAEASRIGVREVEIPTNRLAPGEEPIRIVQLSDVHLGVAMPFRRFQRIVETIRALEPDVLVDTGDFIDTSPHYLDRHIALIKTINPPMGKYAVTGNHEFYVGIDEVEQVHQQTGFTVLRGRHVSIGDGRLILAGVDDPAGRHRGLTPLLDENTALPPFDPEGPPVVLLKHQPRIDTSVLDRFDVQLSGHIHGGQIWPFRWFVALQYDYPVGAHVLGKQKWLIISPGAGTWGTPVRVASPPKILLIRLVPEE